MLRARSTQNANTNTDTKNTAQISEIEYAKNADMTWMKRMSKPLIIGTGWCAHADGHANNKNSSKWMYAPEWLDTWWNYHRRQLFEMSTTYDDPFIYMSDCAVIPNLGWNFETIYSLGNHDLSIHSHDSQVAIIAGAQYAYCNECDFVYIEQDCLIRGLGKAIEWARDNEAKIAYGSGRWSMFPGWAEHSFIYVSYDYLPKFVFKMMNSDIKFNDSKGREVVELTFNRLFKDDATFWPFGYGRRRPIDFDQDVFYAQQLTDAEIEEFLR